MKKKIDMFWYWFLIIVAFVICFMFSSVKVKAANFANSEVKYNEGQSLVYTQIVKDKTYYYYLSIEGTGNFYYITRSYANGSGLYIYHGCSYSNSIITCSKKIDTMNLNFTTTDETNTFTIYVNYVIMTSPSGSTTQYDIISHPTEEDVTNSYNNGYNAGYSAGETAGYNTGFTDGSNGVDITSDNQAYAEQYIIDNNYHTNEDYLNYGSTQYENGKNDYCNNNVCLTNQEYQTNINNAKQEGVNSVDITSDNQSYVEQYIIDNNYHTNEDYLNYGDKEWKKGHGTGSFDMKTVISSSIRNGNYNNIVIETYDDFNGEAKTRVYDLTDSMSWFLSTHNYKTIEEYNEYGQLQYQVGKDSVDITSDNQAYAEQYIIDNNYHTNEDYLNYGSTKLNEGLNNGIKKGYEQANDDGKILGSFVPNLLGGIGSFFLTILNINILGFNLLSIIGIFITVLGIIVIIKFLKG